MSFSVASNRSLRYESRWTSHRPLAALRSPWVALGWTVVALGVLLRLLSIGSGSLGYDEAGYALDAWRLLTGSATPGPYYRSAPGFTALLGGVIYTFGGSDSAVRLLAVLSGAAAALFFLPLARVFGRTGALAGAGLLALSPFWVRLSSVSAPDAVAVMVGVLSVSLAMSRHTWPTGLIAAAALAGYSFSLGATGTWLGAFTLALIAYEAWRAGVAPRLGVSAALAFVLAAAAGYTAFFTQPPRQQTSGLGVEQYLDTGDVLALVATSAPALATLAAVGMLMFFLRNQAAPMVAKLAGMAIVTLLLLVVVLRLLPSYLEPSPALLVLGATVLAAWMVGKLFPAGGALAGAASLLLVALAVGVSALLPPRDAAPVTVPGGIRAVSPASEAVKAAFDRVRRVSSELYVLERSKTEPRGGRALLVEVGPELANWGHWYLRDFPNLRVWPEEGRTPEVQVLAGPRPVPSQGATGENVGQGITLAWTSEVWEQISPRAGADVPGPKSEYGLFDQAPPGDRPGQLDGPVGIATAPNDTVYVVDQNNARVQKYASDGRYLLHWGSKGDGNGQFGDAGPSLGATGIAATDEYVWVADTWNHRIQQFRPDGTFVRAWGEFVDTKGDREANEKAPTGFYGPRGIELGPDGLLYITDTGNKRVIVFTQAGKYVRQWGEGGAGATELDEPIGIAVDSTGSVYVADTRNSRIQVFSSQGQHQRSWRVRGWSEEGRIEPYIAVGPRDEIYVTDPAEKAVHRYTSDGQLLDTRTGDGGLEMLSPLGVAVSEQGELLVADAALSVVLNLSEPR